MSLKNRSLRPIGLDIGHTYVKMIQLLFSGARASVIAANKVRLEAHDPEDREQRDKCVLAAIRKILSRGNFRGRNVVSQLPNEFVKLTSVRVQEAGPVQIKQALAREVSQRFGLDPEIDIINYMNAGTVRQADNVKTELIVLAAADRSIRAHIDLLEEAQLSPVSLDVIPCALFRSFSRSLRRQSDRERTAIFVDVGFKYTTVVFARAGEICLTKQIRLGVQDFDSRIADKLAVEPSEGEILRDKLKKERTAEPAAKNLSAREAAESEDLIEESVRLDPATRQAIVDSISSVAEELAREISLCLRYYTVTFRGKRVENAYVSGGGAYETILLNVMKRKLAVEIEVACPLRGMDLSARTIEADLHGDRRGALSEWAVAVGLSLKGLPKRTRLASERSEEHEYAGPVSAGAEQL